MHLLTAPRLVAEGRLLTPGWVLVDGTVREFGDGEPPSRVRHAATEVTVLTSGVIAPGLVDMHINGAFGADFATADDDELGRGRQAPAEYGGHRISADVHHCSTP